MRRKIINGQNGKRVSLGGGAGRCLKEGVYSYQPNKPKGGTTVNRQGCRILGVICKSGETGTLRRWFHNRVIRKGVRECDARRWDEKSFE